MDQASPGDPAQSLRFWITETRAEQDLQDSPNPFLVPKLQVPAPQWFWAGFFHNSTLFISKFTDAIPDIKLKFYRELSQ